MRIKFARVSVTRRVFHNNPGSKWFTILGLCCDLLKLSLSFLGNVLYIFFCFSTFIFSKLSVKENKSASTRMGTYWCNQRKCPPLKRTKCKCTEK